MSADKTVSEDNPRLMIQVENLQKSFRDLRRGLVHAVDGVSFEARPGEIFGLLGPNGAGKTTTMRILCTVLRPSGGTARVAGHDVGTQPGLVRQHIGFLSANTAIYDRMSAWELVEYFGRLYGLEPEPLRARMEELFETLRMNSFRNVLGAKMSTGMRQKVSLARAIETFCLMPVLILAPNTLRKEFIRSVSNSSSMRALKGSGSSPYKRPKYSTNSHADMRS